MELAAFLGFSACWGGERPYLNKKKQCSQYRIPGIFHRQSRYIIHICISHFSFDELPRHYVAFAGVSHSSNIRDLKACPPHVQPRPLFAHRVHKNFLDATKGRLQNLLTDNFLIFHNKGAPVIICFLIYLFRHSGGFCTLINVIKTHLSGAEPQMKRML